MEELFDCHLKVPRWAVGAGSPISIEYVSYDRGVFDTQWLSLQSGDERKGVGEMSALCVWFMSVCGSFVLMVDTDEWLLLEKGWWEEGEEERGTGSSVLVAEASRRPEIWQAVRLD